MTNNYLLHGRVLVYNVQQLATIKPFVFERLQVGLEGRENVKSGYLLRLQRAASVESKSKRAPKCNTFFVHRTIPSKVN